MIIKLLVAMWAVLILPITIAVGQATPNAPQNADEGFEPISFMADSCWEGPLPGFVAQSTGVGPRSVTHCVRWRLEDKILTDTLYLDGLTPPIRGETNYYWDSEANVLRYIFWSIGGSYSVGTMKADGKILIFDDERLVGGGSGTVHFTTSWTPEGPDAFIQNRQRQNADGTWTNSEAGTFKRIPLR